MERYYGFDLGDAESAVARLSGGKDAVPEILGVRDAKSFITAYAQLLSGEVLIGESACYDTGAIHRSLRFKSRFLTDPDSEKDLRRFAAGVLSELYGNADLVENGENCFYIGCPAGWDRAARERYRRIFEDTGYPPARIVSESRAAMISACQSKHLQVGYDITAHSVLVVDMGSSTTDFAYILGRREVELQTAGEVRFGGGLMDEALLERCADTKALREALDGSPAWRSYCEFAARRLKEKYFSDEDYWRDNECVRTIPVRGDPDLRLTLRMDRRAADALLTHPMPSLGGKSFRETFLSSLRDVRDRIEDRQPELLFLTGGVSKMRAVRDWCAEVFPEAVVITGAEPEFSVARGLAWSGRIDSQLRKFRREVDDLIASHEIEAAVDGSIDDLYRSVVDALVDPILKEVALPAFDRWRRGEIRRLSDIDAVMQKDIEAWLHTDRAQEILYRPIAEWLRPVAYRIEEKTMPICLKYDVPYKAMSLTSYFALSDIDIRIDAKDVFAFEGLTWLINAIVSIIVGLVCGGSGVALVSGGLSGVIAGAVVSLLLLLLGKQRMQNAFVKADMPVALRRIVPRSHFESRLDRISDEVKADFYNRLEKEKKAGITQRMSREISQQIEECLARMAQIVEIPL